MTEWAGLLVFVCFSQCTNVHYNAICSTIQ